jgi:hypothetical protein
MVPLLIAVLVLVIIGLIDFDLMVSLIAKLIVAIVIVGVFILLVKRLFFPR